MYIMYCFVDKVVTYFLLAFYEKGCADNPRNMFNFLPNSLN